MTGSSQISYIVLKLLKQVENRLCADCDCPLAETEVFAVVNHGVWVCHECAMLNNFFEGTGSSSKPLNRVLSLSHLKDVKDIELMKKAASNVRRNTVLERYIPSDWVKIKPNSSIEDRKHWIQAKYESMLFMLPAKAPSSSAVNTSATQLSTINSPRRPTASKDRKVTTLPASVADYFAIVEPKSLPGHSIERIDPSTIEDITFEPYISSIYPPKPISKDNPIPDMISDFVHPNGLHLSRFEKAPYFFTFVLTNTSGKSCNNFDLLLERNRNVILYMHCTYCRH